MLNFIKSLREKKENTALEKMARRFATMANKIGGLSTYAYIGPSCTKVVCVRHDKRPCRITVKSNSFEFDVAVKSPEMLIELKTATQHASIHYGCGNKKIILHDMELDEVIEIITASVEALCDEDDNLKRIGRR